MSMEYSRELEDLVGTLLDELAAAREDASSWSSRYDDLLRDFHRVCDERADLEARVQEFEFAVQRDKDGDGFINKECMDELFPDTAEGESE